MTRTTRQYSWAALRCAAALSLVAAGSLYFQATRTPEVAHAAGTCAGITSGTEYFDGAETNSSAYSAKATLPADGAALCTPTETKNYFAAWAMMGPLNKSEYAQVGYIQNPDGTLNYFIQATYDNNGSGSYNKQWGAPALGSSHTFAVQYNFSTLYYDFYIDGASQGSTPWQPGSVWNGAYYPMYFGEAPDYQDDIPTNQNAPMQFTSMRAISSWNGSWTVPSGLYVNISQNPGNPNWRATLNPSTGIMGIYTYCPSNCGYTPSP